MTHSDPQICHRKPPLFPSPENAQYCYAIQGPLNEQLGDTPDTVNEIELFGTWGKNP